MWAEEPAAVFDHFAMKVAARPLRKAISFTAFLTITWSSAAPSASR